MLDAYLDRHYRGPSMVLAAAGAVDHDALVALAEERFGDLGRAARAEAGCRRTIAAATCARRATCMETQIMLGFEGRPYASEDFYAAQVLAAILGGGMSSRLFQEVREKRGLCYSIYAFHWSFSDTGLFGVHAATGPERRRRTDAGGARRTGARRPRHHRERTRPRAGRSCAPAC